MGKAEEEAKERALVEEELREDLEDAFDAATAFVALHISDYPSFTDAVKLRLYGYYKQATEGPCTTPKPGMFDLKGKSKW